MSNDRARRQQALKRGGAGEWRAALALMLKGWRVVARRYRTPLGEIDIVARRGDLVAIVEAKARPTVEDAMDAVGYQAQKRIERAADLWLATQPDYARLSLRFDLIAVLPRRWPIHIENAWQGRN